MSAPAAWRRGWCPSVARPMPSGDGLLVRLSLPVGTVPPALAHGIASCARRFGNGLIDLTRRANLQLRGLSEATMPALIEELSSLEAFDSAHEQDAARDIIMSPLAGIDPKAACDIRPIVKALRERLASEPPLKALPAKFCFIVEDGGQLGLDDIAADIRFKASRSSDRLSFTVALGGCEGEARAVGTCAPPALPDVAAALARAFLELRGEGEAARRRMAPLLAREGTETILRAAGLEAQLLPDAETARGAATLPLPERHLPIGIVAPGIDKPAYFGVGVPFGRLTADQLDDLAGHAEASSGEIRLTPWRVILVANNSMIKAMRMYNKLEDSGFIIASSDARLWVVACPGTPACTRATVATRDDALMLAPGALGLSMIGIGLHVSGCAKGCARSVATKVTLVGRDGLYDLVLDGIAGDPPVRVGLTPQEAKEAVARILEEVHAERDYPGMKDFEKYL